MYFIYGSNGRWHILLGASGEWLMSALYIGHRRRWCLGWLGPMLL